MFLHPVLHAERDVETDGCGVFAQQLADAGFFQVIPVVVRNQDGVDRRQIGEGDADRLVTFGADEGKGRGAFAPMRVGKDVEAVNL